MAAKTETLTDTFTSLNTTKWVKQPPAVVSGSLQCGAGGLLVSRNRYDLTNSYVKVEVTTVGQNFVVVAADSLAAGSQATRSGALLACSDGQLVVYTADWSAFYEDVHDPVNHRWLRIRESGGIIYWETSPNGSAWTEFFSAPAPSDGVVVALGGNNCVFDNLN